MPEPEYIAEMYGGGYRVRVRNAGVIMSERYATQGLKRRLIATPWQLMLLLCCLTAASYADPISSAATPHAMSYVYPAPESAGDVRYHDLITLLQAALDHTAEEYGPYTLGPANQPMTESRYLSEIAKPASERRLVSVVWSSTSEEKERDLTAIRIPLRKGLLGYRICLIAADRQPALDNVNSLEDLRRFTIGQGLGWGDIDIYNSNDFHLITATYKQLFAMTAIGRFDLFPRGIGEVFNEFDENHAANPKLAIEKHLVLYYPWPYYYFFNHADARLAERVEKGLWMMIHDGSFDAIFMHFNGEAIRRADLRNRRLIRLRNPILPKNTPLDSPALWYDPAKD
jgi:hypothetical protein